MRQIVLFALLSTAPLAIAQGESPPATLLPLEATVFDAARAAHLLSRAGFGATPQEAQALALLGLEKAVSSLVEATAVEATPAFEPSVTDRPSRDELKNKTQEERQKLVREHRRKDQDQFQSLRGWWLQGCINGIAV